MDDLSAQCDRVHTDTRVDEACVYKTHKHYFCMFVSSVFYMVTNNKVSDVVNRQQYMSSSHVSSYTRGLLTACYNFRRHQSNDTLNIV